ncbi:hypothetical protein BVX98_06740, partial [bacterium F11]
TLSHKKLPDFRGQIEAWHYDLTPIAQIISPPQIEVDNAILNGDIMVQYADGKFDSEGKIHLTGSQLTLRREGIGIKDIKMDFIGDQSRILISKGIGISLSKYEQKKKEKRKKKIKKKDTQKPNNIQLTGAVNISGPDLELKANNLWFEMAEGLSGTTDLLMECKGTWDSLDLVGEINILQADFVPPKKKGKNGNGTVVEKPMEPPGSHSVDLKIQFDKRAWFKDGSTAIENKGILFIKKRKNEHASVIGDIEVIRGDYVFYGWIFKIQEGKLHFPGGRELDPHINAKGLYTDPDSRIKIYIKITGTLLQPELIISSDPPMDERDILSVLVTGKPMHELQGERNRSKREAVEALIGHFGLKKVEDKIKKTIKVDVLRLRVKNQDEARLTVGRYVRPNLYVAYDQTVGPKGQRQVNAQYTLSPLWGLEGRTSSDGRYIIDLLFKYGIK